MKLAVLMFISALMFSSLAYSQRWKDSLLSARTQYQQRNYEAAFKTYQQAKKIAPKKIDFSMEMAQAAYKAQRFQEAEKIYDQSGGKYAPSIEKAKTYHNLGNSKLRQKKYEEAIQSYRESLRNNPADEETRYNLAKAMKTQKTEQQKQPQKQPQKPQNPSPNQQQGPKKEKQDQAQQPSKLNDKKTDRMLDDLMKKEMDTKKKMDKQKGQVNPSNSGIDW